MGNPQTFSEKGEKIWTNKSLFETNLFTYSVISVSETEASDLGKCLKMHQHVSRCISMNSESSSVVCDMTRPVSAITEMVCQDLPKPVDEKTLLTGLNSLAAVELTNHLRDFTGRDVHVADILGCVTVGDLAQKIERSKFIEKISTDAEKSEYRCQLWGWGFPCAWVFEFENSWLHYRSLQSAISGLCKRHPALLTTCIDSKALSYWMNECLVVVGLLRHLSPPWFGWLVAGIGRCVFESWNRVSSRQDRELRIGWKKFQTESEFREYLLEKKRKPNFYAPTEVDVVVLSSGGRDRYFVRLYVTHAFSDGSCVVPILKDLTELYNAAVDQREPNLGPVPPNAFQIQENRLRHSLTDPITADPRKDSFYLCYNMDMDDSKDLCSFGRIVILDESFVLVAQAAARSLAVPIDVLFLSAIAASLARLWNWADLVQLALVVPLRDGPHEAEVVGFLADQRNIDIPLIGRNLTSLATVVQVVHALRRARGWEIPSPFTNCERTLVNIVQANFPEDARFRQELVIQQHEAAMGMLYRPMELYVEQLQPYMWSLKARCRLREYSPEKFERFCGIFKQVVIEMLQSPNKPLLQ
jgi:acyl carrier protein